MVIGLSVLLAVVGILATGRSIDRLGSSARDPHVWWGVGIAALLPAWLVLFVGLLPDSPGARQHSASAVAWLLSSASGLVGVIATEARLRRLEESGHHVSARRFWRLGLIALAPSWVVAVAGHILQ